MAAGTANGDEEEEEEKQRLLHLGAAQVKRELQTSPSLNLRVSQNATKP